MGFLAVVLPEEPGVGNPEGTPAQLSSGFPLPFARSGAEGVDAGPAAGGG